MIWVVVLVSQLLTKLWLIIRPFIPYSLYHQPAAPLTGGLLLHRVTQIFILEGQWSWWPCLCRVVLATHELELHCTCILVRVLLSPSNRKTSSMTSKKMTFVHSFVHPFGKCLLSTTVHLGAENSAVNKMSCLHKTFLLEDVGKKTINQ